MHKLRDCTKFESYDSLQLTMKALVGASGRKSVPAGHQHCYKGVGMSHTAPRAINYCQVKQHQLELAIVYPSTRLHVATHTVGAVLPGLLGVATAPNLVI